MYVHGIGVLKEKSDGIQSIDLLFDVTQYWM